VRVKSMDCSSSTSSTFMENHLHDTRVVVGRPDHGNPRPPRDLLPLEKAQGMPKPEAPPPDSPLPEKGSQLLLPALCIISRGRRDEVLSMRQLSKILLFLSRLAGDGKTAWKGLAPSARAGLFAAAAAGPQAPHPHHVLSRGEEPCGSGFSLDRLGTLSCAAGQPRLGSWGP